MNEGSRWPSPWHRHRGQVFPVALFAGCSYPPECQREFPCYERGHSGETCSSSRIALSRRAELRYHHLSEMSIVCEISNYRT